MTSRSFITMRSDYFHLPVDLELPGDRPLRELLPDILRTLNWSESINNQSIDYQLRIEDKPLSLDESINSAGIENFQSIWITPPDGLIKQDLTEIKADKVDSEAPAAGSIPFWKRISVTRPSLISPKGVMFVLGKPPVLIGRSDTNAKVNVDLSELETDGWVSSRRHAEIIQISGGGWTIRSFKTTNGTYLNGTDLPAGTTAQLKNGDSIQFGFRGVRLFFRLPADGK